MSEHLTHYDAGTREVIAREVAKERERCSRPCRACDEDAIAQAEAEADRWREKAQEAGASYALANTKHHAELDRANRLETMCDRLAERLVVLPERWQAEGRAVMFNRDGDDLTPQQRVGKWLAEQTRIAREAGQS